MRHDIIASFLQKKFSAKIVTYGSDITSVTLSRLGVPSSHDLRVTDHCRPDFSLERTGPLPTF